MKIGGVTNFDLLITMVKSKNIFLAPKPEVTMWPEMKPEVFYRPKLSRNFLEWMTKTIMSHIIWLMIIVEFCLWPINLWIDLLSSGSRYSKTDFSIVFLMRSFISESYWLFVEMVDHMIVCAKKGRHGYQNDSFCILSSFPILFRSCRSFRRIFPDF